MFRKNIIYQSLASSSFIQIVGIDFILILVAIGLLIPAIVWGESGSSAPLIWLIRVVLGSAFVLYLPGHCLSAVLFTRSDDLDTVERIGLAIGLSLAWLSLLVPVLALFGFKLSLWPIVFVEVVSILIFMGLAVWRRTRLPLIEPIDKPHGIEAIQQSATHGSWATVGVSVLVGLLFVAAMFTVYGFEMAVNRDPQHTTEFYMLGINGRGENYPRDGHIEEELSVTLGIVHHGVSPAKYRVELWGIDPWKEKQQLVATINDITLANTEVHEQEISWSMPWAGANQLVKIYLYPQSSESSEPYRQLHFWIDVQE